MDQISESPWVGRAGIVGLLWFVSAFIRSTTKDFDDDLSADARMRLANRMSSLAVFDAAWMAVFRNVFESAFGDRHFSWKCFGRSMVLSGLLYVLVAAATGLFPDVSKIAKTYEQGLWMVWGEVLAGWMAFGMLFNGLVDYLSLWKTRVLIKSSMRSAYKVCIDFVATVLIVNFLFYIAIGLLVYIGFSLELEVKGDPSGAFLLVAAILSTSFMSFPPMVGTIAFVIFSTSFSATVWLVIHLSGSWIMRLLPTSFSILNTRDRPVRSAGVLGIVALWIVAIVIAFIRSLYLWMSDSA